MLYPDESNAFTQSAILKMGEVFPRWLKAVSVLSLLQLFNILENVAISLCLVKWLYA